MEHETTLQTKSQHHQCLSHIHTKSMFMHTSYTGNVQYTEKHSMQTTELFFCNAGWMQMFP